MSTLKRTQMYFPEDMLAELKLFAGAKKESISEVVREAVSTFLK